MNTSIVIPLGHGSRNNDLELRYCLRSVEKYLTGYGDVFIIGNKPGWLKNVIHIPYDEGFAPRSHEKERNIFNKIMAGCADERVTDDFLFMNDDHYLLSGYLAGEFPFYHDGLLTEKMTITDYKQTVNNSIDFFRTEALQFSYWGEVKYYDIHCPITYNKQLFKLLSKYWSKDLNKPFGVCLKTMYSNNNFYWPAGGLEDDDSQYPDLKINAPYTSDQIRQILAGRSWFSIGDKAFDGDIKQVLQELYPEKSKYEY